MISNCLHSEINDTDIASNKGIGWIYMKDTLDISFWIQVHAECIGQCNILNIDRVTPRIYTYSNLIHVDLSNLTHSMNIAILPEIYYFELIDTEWHYFNFKMSSTNIIVNFDNYTVISGEKHYLSILYWP